MMYVGRFAPSPTGPLHAGSLVTALASWLDARVHGGRWLVRIEDIDTPRCQAGADAEILRQLAGCGLLPDAPVWRQSERDAAYQAALDRLLDRELAYGCACSRSDVGRALRESGRDLRQAGELVYPGTCRTGLGGRKARAWRLRLPQGNLALVNWTDIRLGAQQEQVDQVVGDFVLKRADGLWAYQLAVVVDDAAQSVSHVVRGEDLVASTARQIQLQRALGLPTPQYLHVPLLRDAQGRKLSKQDGSEPFIPGLHAIMRAARFLGLEPVGATLAEVLTSSLAGWADQRARWEATRSAQN